MIEIVRSIDFRHGSFACRSVEGPREFLHAFNKRIAERKSREFRLRDTNDGESDVIAAVEDAASVIVMVQLGAEDSVDAVGSHITFGRQ